MRDVGTQTEFQMASSIIILISLLIYFFLYYTTTTAVSLIRLEPQNKAIRAGKYKPQLIAKVLLLMHIYLVAHMTRHKQ